MKPTEILTAIVAVYAAILSTIKEYLAEHKGFIRRVSYELKVLANLYGSRIGERGQSQFNQTAS